MNMITMHVTAYTVMGAVQVEIAAHLEDAAGERRWVSLHASLIDPAPIEGQLAGTLEAARTALARCSSSPDVTRLDSNRLD